MALLTIQALVDDREFGLRYLAGETGGGRPVTWAHSIDLGDPWNWVEQGTVILTTGAGIPTQERQQEWMESVIASGASGLIVALQTGANEIGKAALVVADERRFPVVGAEFDVKFSRLARQVINHTMEYERERNEASRRIFNSYFHSIVRNETSRERLNRTATQSGIAYGIRDRTGTIIIPDTVADPAAYSMATRNINLGDNQSGLQLRLFTSANDEKNATLEANFNTVVHLEMQLLSREGRIQQVVDEQVLEDWFAKRTPQANGMVAFVLRFPDGQDRASRLVRKQIHGLTTSNWKQDKWVGIGHAEPGLGKTLTSIFPEARIGIGEPVSGTTTPEMSLRQAEQGARRAEPGSAVGLSEREYPVSIVPSVVAEAYVLAERFLGPIRQYDEKKNTELLTTLQRFIENDQASGDTAKSLNIHRHTLAYRLKTIERIAGLSPVTAEGIATYWVAFQASKQSGWLV